MPRYSDSNYAAVTRHRRPNAVVPTTADAVWGSEALLLDDVEISQHEAAVAPLLEEGELDADAIVVSPTGNSSAAANSATERRRREEGWNDLALDQFDVGSGNPGAAASNLAGSNAPPSAGEPNPRTPQAGSG